MWNAFSGYQDIYGKPPPARKVRKVTAYLMAVNEYEHELQEEQEREIEEARRKAERGY